jgi:hypothetical protein
MSRYRIGSDLFRPNGECAFFHLGMEDHAGRLGLLFSVFHYAEAWFSILVFGIDQAKPMTILVIEMELDIRVLKDERPLLPDGGHIVWWSE